MIVRCDKCGAKFQLADEKITDKGAKVRCSKCKNIFTVKKGQAEEAPSGAADKPGTGAPSSAVASPPPPPPSPPPSPLATGQTEAARDNDPFADFSFSEDLDFSDRDEKEIQVSAPAKPSPPPQVKVGPSFLNDGPVVSGGGGGEKPMIKDDAPPVDEGFDFSDEEFSLSDEEKAASSPSPPAADKGGDFGDFQFDEESFDKPEPAKPAVKAAPSSAKVTAGDEEWGNVSFSDETPEIPRPTAPGKRGTDEIDDLSFGDFKFDSDDHLPPSSSPEESIMTAEDVGDFVRSAGSRAPARDDLEAHLGETETEERPEPRKVERREEPPSPPKSAVRPAARPSGGKLKYVIIISAVMLAIPLGLVAFTHSRGWFTFSDLLAGDFGKLAELPDKFFGKPPEEENTKEIKGQIEIDKEPENLKRYFVERKNGEKILVVEGNVINKTNVPQSEIKVEVQLLSKATGQLVLSGFSYCDVSFTKEELGGDKELSREQIENYMKDPVGKNMGCSAVPPDEFRKFTVVFFEVPQEKVGLHFRVESSVPVK